MMRKDFLKGGISIIFHNPSLIFNLFTLDFDKIYCSYWNLKLKKCKKMYEKWNERNRNIIEQIKTINKEILNEKYSKHEAFFIPIYFMIRLRKPDVVIETGVHRGVSSLFILQALEDNNKGILYSIDLPFASYELKEGITTKSNLPIENVGICVQQKLRKRWKLIFGDSKNELPIVLANHESIDFFLHDSQHTFEHMMWEFNTIWPKLAKSGLLVSDDINWNNAFTSFSSKVRCENIQLYRDSTKSSLFGVILKKLDL